MAKDIPIRCSCGKLRAVAVGIDASKGNHLVCYCDDCQSFQHFLGTAERVLDEHGGTEIFQMSQGRLRITEGSEHLACVRLRENGLLRWYASCCNTPIGNTLAARGVPFIGVVCDCFDRDRGGESLDDALGPVRMGVNGRFAKGKPDGLTVHDRAPLSMFVSFIGKMLAWRLHGDHKRSPLFEPESGRIRVEPTVLSESRLKQVEERRDS